MFTENGKREFVPRDQVFTYLSLSALYFYTVFIDLLTFYFENFLTWVCRLPFSVNVTLKLPNIFKRKQLPPIG